MRTDFKNGTTTGWLEVLKSLLGVPLLMGLLGWLPMPVWALNTHVVVSGLEHPWGLAFLDEGQMLVSERPGRLRLVSPNGELSEPLGNVPPVDAVGQGGMLDVIADVDFAVNRRVFFCFSQAAANGGGNATALASARLPKQAKRLESVRVIFRQQPNQAGRLHFGCRIVQSPNGHLFLSLGERYHRMADAQNLSNHLGKVVRLTIDGGVPSDNPLRLREGADPYIWSWGHRNPQGAAWGPDGRLWVVEHGPQGGDELNRLEPGKNYGWPVITHGENYGGGPIGQGLTLAPGMEQPVHHWTPSIAPSGLALVTSPRYGAAWQGTWLVGSLKFRQLVQLTLHQGRVIKEERHLTQLGQRVRDVRQGPDGWIYLLTDEAQGQLLRLIP